MSLIKNREFFKISSRTWNIIRIGGSGVILVKFAEQQGSDYQRKEEVNYFESET